MGGLFAQIGSDSDVEIQATFAPPSLLPGDVSSIEVGSAGYQRLRQ